MWFDPDVNRINYEEHGRFLGEFSDDDRILVVLTNGDFYITNFDSNNHYESNILRIEKWDDLKVWTAIVLDADNQGTLTSNASRWMRASDHSRSSVRTRRTNCYV